MHFLFYEKEERWYDYARTAWGKTRQIDMKLTLNIKKPIEPVLVEGINWDLILLITLLVLLALLVLLILYLKYSKIEIIIVPTGEN